MQWHAPRLLAPKMRPLRCTISQRHFHSEMKAWTMSISVLEVATSSKSNGLACSQNATVFSVPVDGFALSKLSHFRLAVSHVIGSGCCFFRQWKKMGDATLNSLPCCVHC